MYTGFFQNLWILIHTIAFFLPPRELTKEEVARFDSFFLQFLNLIPCPGCADHAAEYILSNYKAYRNCKTGTDFFEFTVTFHNHVNKRYNKREFSKKEAIFALLNHIQGRSELQIKLENDVSATRIKLCDVTDRIHMLKNECHLIQPETKRSFLSEKDRENDDIANYNVPEITDNFDFAFLFDSLLMIASEFKGVKTNPKKGTSAFQDLVVVLVDVLPFPKLKEDSLVFLKTQQEYPVRFEMSSQYRNSI